MNKKLYQTAHPQFVMPDIEIPDGFIDTSYENDEYPSWSLDDEALNQTGYSTMQLWIAYDHGYDNNTWEDIEEWGLYQVTFQPLETRGEYLDYNENAIQFFSSNWNEVIKFIENNSK
tara:strand:- start:391 stop:741 length:351 start_codon:yes stop_codon:yes gene_type:complete